MDVAAPRGLDPEWIADRLTGDGGRPEAEFEGLIGDGQMSRTARYSLRGAAESSVVVKLPSAELVTRSTCFERGTYWRECEFYESVLPQLEVSTPRALVIHHSAVDEDFALVLEDLSGSEAGDQFSVISPDRLDLAIDQLAGLHGPLWGRLDSLGLPEMLDRSRARALRYPAVIDAALAVVMDRLGERLDDGIPELLAGFVDAADRWVELAFAPVTVVHGDFRPDNLMFGVAADAPPVAVLDWQAVAAGIGSIDTAFLIGGSLEPDHRRRAEPELLARYRTGLAGFGVEYSPEQCARDTAIGSLYGVAMAMNSTVRADVTERGDSLFTLMLNRHGRHALDLDALAVVEDS